MFLKKKNICCLIPFYNEGNNVLLLIKRISKISLIDEIVCVDGGSTDKVSDIISVKYPKVKLLKLNKKGGKAEDVKRSLNLVKSDYVLLLDADIRNLDFRKIKQGIEEYLKINTESILIYVNTKTHMIEKLLKGNYIVCGDRILKRKHLKEVFQNYRPSGYQLEVAINQYALDRNMDILFKNIIFDIPNKSQKWGFFRGLFKDISMQFEILNYTGIIGWIKQYRIFTKIIKEGRK